MIPILVKYWFYAAINVLGNIDSMLETFAMKCQYCRNAGFIGFILAKYLLVILATKYKYPNLEAIFSQDLQYLTDIAILLC